MTAISLRAAQNTSIKDVDIAELLSQTEPYADCMRQEHQGVSTHELEYFDFTGDGNPEAIFVGGSCFTGTGGPDIHKVYQLGDDGRLRELPILYPEQPRLLVGNRNYRLHQRDGLLMAQYWDSSLRDNPLTEYYRWNGTEFQFVGQERDPVFETSFDCFAANNDVLVQICIDEELARLDREVDATYRRLRDSLEGERREALMEDQQEWLSRRDRRCWDYKRGLECLLDLYRERLQTLEAPGQSW